MLAQLPSWYMTVQNVYAAVVLVLGIGAVVLLVASFIKRGADEASPTALTETG